MKPSGLMITPLPRPLCGTAPCSPKKKRNHGSLAEGRSAALLVLMLTTACEALRAALRKLPSGDEPLGALWTSRRAIPVLALVVGRGLSHSGLSVITTK